MGDADWFIIVGCLESFVSFDGYPCDNQPTLESLEWTIYPLSYVVQKGIAQDVPKNLPIISWLVYSAIIANCNWPFPLVVSIVLSYRLSLVETCHMSETSSANLFCLLALTEG